MAVESITLNDDAVFGLTTSDQHFRMTAALPIEVKLGYKQSPVRPQALSLSHYMTAMGAIQLPEKVDYYTKAAESLARMYRNDALGCCVITGKAHSLGVWSSGDSDSGPIVLATDKEIDQQYFGVCGGGDNGCYIPAVLDYMRDQGFVASGKRYKIAGYAAVDWKSKELVQRVLAGFGACTIGFKLPSAWSNAAVWEPTNSRIVGGHDVTPCGYGSGIEMDPDGGGPKRFVIGELARQASLGSSGTSLCMSVPRPFTGQTLVPTANPFHEHTFRVKAATADGVIVSSWGRLYLITWPAFTSTRWITEMYVMVPVQLWTGADKKSPLGLDFDRLVSDMQKLAGGDIPPLPDPVPDPLPVPDPFPVVPPPSPPPSPPVTPPPPPHPEPTMIPSFNVTLSGSFPSGVLGTPTPVELKGVATPQTPLSSGLSTDATQPLTAVPWSIIIQFASKVIPVVIADVAAGKRFDQIVMDVLAAIVPSMSGQDRHALANELSALAASRTREEWFAIATALVQWVLKLFAITPKA